MSMEQMALQIPKMWADHHVLAVREILAALGGVEEIEASAARTLLRVSYDPATVRRDQVLRALCDAGYDPTESVEYAEPPANKDQGAAWFVRDQRMTQTNRLDLEMSGDFRKY